LQLLRYQRRWSDPAAFMIPAGWTGKVSFCIVVAVAVKLSFRLLQPDYR
jgi:hypothetical protein